MSGNLKSGFSWDNCYKTKTMAFKKIQEHYKLSPAERERERETITRT
jgi:hypothetical protein